MAGSDGAREASSRLAAVVERQRRDIARLRAERDADAVIAMATGVLIERGGGSPAEAARQLSEMAAAADLPLAEMALAVLHREPPRPSASVSAGEPADTSRADTSRADTSRADAPPADAPPAVPAEAFAAAVVSATVGMSAMDGVELVGVLAEHMRAQVDAMAVAAWLLEPDGALEMLGQSGLSGTESSRWRRIPPQFDCPEQRAAVGADDVWQPARVILALRDRAGAVLGVLETWWDGPRAESSPGLAAELADVAAGFADVLAARLSGGSRAGGSRAGGSRGDDSRGALTSALAPGALAPGVPSLASAVYGLLDEIAGSVLVLRPIRDPSGKITDFSIVHLSPGYTDPAGRPGAELAGPSLLEAYPAAASAAGDGLFARAVRVADSGAAEYVRGEVAAPLTGELAGGDA
ncbi:MAG: ANTAR domain-containing protein, partial [Trebonia sp.]